MASVAPLRRGVLAFDPEVRVLVMALVLDVLLDNFVRDVAAADTEVAPRPDVPPPELLAQVRELLHQLERTLPLERLHEPTDGHSRRHAHEQVHMIFRDMPLDDRHLVLTADFADQLSHAETDLARHGWLAVLRDPHHVEVDAEDRMRAVPVLSHGAALYHAGENLLKPSPKGEGFDPPR